MMLCPNKECKFEPLVYLGATVGATRLMGCPKCYQVYWKEKP